MSPRDAIVTGVGCVSPIGVGRREFAGALRRGESGVRLLGARYPTARCRVSATCPGFDPSRVLSAPDIARLPRLVPMALAAATEAIDMAGLARADALTTEDSRAIGLILGTGGGGIDFTLDQAARFHAGERTSLWTITNATHGNLAGELSIRLGLRGPSLCVSTGCASSSDAFGFALEMLRSDRPGAPEAVVVVGADAHVREETLAGMELLGVLTLRDVRTPEEAAGASRPFDASRDGFVLGEGAWAAVLERPARAARRGASALARVLGYGATCDAFHRVRPDPTMVESARAMRLCLDDARVSPEDVDVVHFHGTGTRLNDELETASVKTALGDHARRVRGSAIKSMIGHPQGAGGAAAVVGAIASALAMDGDPRGPFVPPTISRREADPRCDLDCTPLAAASHRTRHALINCLAFGAKNSALLIGF